MTSMSHEPIPVVHLYLVPGTRGTMVGRPRKNLRRRRVRVPGTSTTWYELVQVPYVKHGGSSLPVNSY